ncbi:GNAT family N-acetyltransferase [Allokutzneria sp. A3M-2-11 16]|uniref:GNAT family N-acetyltransferase n=1 Tax=Allokutzneria sp. A3M-2-11 16 TaxID=2962043 RepID=UPI0035A8B4C1
MLDLELRVVGYDHPDAAKLISEVQQEYVVRYGDEDVTPVDPAEFAPPLGLFIVGYLNEEAVVCGGWRAHDSDDPQFLDGDAEIKRMYVVGTARGKGLAKRMLVELERTARDAGRRRMVLETGTQQPEAVALYSANGYERIQNFGAYKDHPLSLCFAKSLY